MYKEQIDWLISYLKQNSNISSIFWDRVFYVLPVNNQEKTSLFVNMLAENRKLSESETLMEFRIITYSDDLWPLDIQKYISTIKDEFEKNSIEIWDHTYYQIDISTDTFVAINDHKHYEGVFSMTFKNSR